MGARYRNCGTNCRGCVQLLATREADLSL